MNMTNRDNEAIHGMNGVIVSGKNRKSDRSIRVLTGH